MRQFKTLIFTTAIAVACLGLLACGSITSKKSAATAKTAVQTPQNTTVATESVGSASSRKVIASVGSEPITLASVEHLMTIANAPVPLPDPPAYASCIARMKTEAAPAATNVAAHGTTQLKTACQKRYEELLETALSSAIHGKWVIGEASEQGLTVSAREIQREFDQSRKSAFRTNAQFEAYRKGTRETIADLKKELELSKLSDKLIRKANEGAHPATKAEVAAFYKAHHAQFVVPAGRTVRIIRTATEGSAIRAKKQLEAGKSFASLAKELATIAQPAGTKSGEVADLKPGAYEEKKLNDAIFAAQLNRLSGPLELTATHKTIAGEPNTGFFVFEVKKIVPGGQIPLTKVQYAIAEELTKGEQTKTFTSYVRTFRGKWTARTSCQPGYIVNNCPQFKASKAQRAGELNSL